MLANKNANIRYRVLGRCFRDKRRKHFIEDLFEECNQALRADSFKEGVKRSEIYDNRS